MSYQQLPIFQDLNDRERRQLDFFVNVAAPRLAGSLDKDFWCNHILQLAQTEKFVRDGALAISSLYEHPHFLASFYSNPQGNGQLQGADVLEDSHAEALRHYNRALRAFRSFSAQSENVAPGLLLLSCSIFICIEMIRDNVFAALKLYQQGVSLIQQLGNASKDHTHDLVCLCKGIIGRVGTLIPSLADTSLMLLPAEGIKIGRNYDNFGEARTALFSLIMETSAFAVDVSTWRERVLKNADHDYTPQAVASIPTIYGVVCHLVENPGYGRSTLRRMSESISIAASEEWERLQQRQQELRKCFAAWCHAMSALSLHTEGATLDYLFMLYYSTTIWLSAQLFSGECEFDGLDADFDKVLHHAQLFLDAVAGEMPVFTFEIGATPALFLVASRCRLPSLRRRALSTMVQAPRKECMHGSLSTAEFARRLIEIEEEGLGLPRPEIALACSNDVEIDDSVRPLECKRISKPELFTNFTRDFCGVSVERTFEMDGIKWINISRLPL